MRGFRCVPGCCDHREPGWRKQSPAKRKIPWRAFLRQSRSGSPFAGNRFQTREEVVRFFRTLEKFGATRVSVSNLHDEPCRIRLEGGAYADVVNFCVRRGNYDVLAAVAKEQPDTLGPERGNCYGAWWD